MIQLTADMSIDTVIFDLDGTLLDTLCSISTGFNFALKSFGFKERTIEEVRIFVGNGIKKAFEAALGSDADEQMIDDITAVFKEYYTAHLYEHTKPYDGIIEMLKALKEKNYKMGVVSNKYDAAVKALCSNYFSGYITAAIGECPGTARKPSADGIIKVMGALGSGFDNIIYTGDSEVDIQTAANVNVPCISVLWGFKDEEFLKSRGGRVFAQKPQDVIDIIEKKLYLV